MFKKIASASLAVMMASSAITAASVQPAEARRGARVAAGVAAGIIGLGILGAYAHARDRDRYESRSYRRACYKGPERCRWTGRECFHNRFGERICTGGHYRCWRETICD